MIVVPFTADHMAKIERQDAQLAIGRYLTPEHALALQQHPSFTALDGDRVLACSGVIEVWPGRAIAWAVIAGDLKSKFIGVHKAVSRFLAMAPYSRIEADVDVDFAEGHRWMEKLGFQLECPRMKKFRPDGGDSALYVRIK